MPNQQISLFLPALYGGGAERVMVNLANGFSARGFKTDLVLAKAEGPYLPHVSPNVQVLDLASKGVLSSLPKLVRYLKTSQPNVLLSAVDHANVSALLAKRLAGTSTRVVISVHTMLSSVAKKSGSAKDKVLPHIAKRSYRYADAIVTVSHGVALDAKRAFRLPSDKIHTVYNPIISDDLSSKADLPVTHPWLEAAQPPIILAVGRLERAKDYPTLLKAFAEVRKNRICRLIICGEGGERQRLEQLVRELKIEEAVDLVGFVDNPYAYMKHAHLLVLSSVHEGLPSVLIEALALGRPVIATNCPSGPAEVLAECKYGQLVDVADHRGLAAAIEQYLTLVPKLPSDLQKHLDQFRLAGVVTEYLKVLDAC